MPDKQEPPLEKPGFDIPEPKVETLAASVVDNLSVSEEKAFSSPSTLSEWRLRSTRRNWWVNVTLKVLLFTIVIFLNFWWTHRVLQLLWNSADSKSQYHLDNSVLIALVTTSLANFLALVIIVAKNLFPS